MAETRHPRGLVDTSVVIGLESIEPANLPVELAVSAITMAELAAGPHATADPAERARRQDRLQRTEATFDPLPVDAGVARVYGRVYAAVCATGRKTRGRRLADLLYRRHGSVGASLPWYTRNPDDFGGLAELLEDRRGLSGLAPARRQCVPDPAWGDCEDSAVAHDGQQQAVRREAVDLSGPARRPRHNDTAGRAVRFAL